MSQSKAQIYLHIIFSTKNRAAYLKDKAFRERVHAYLSGICRNQESPSIIVGGVEDHVHVLCRMSKNIAPKDLVRELKSDSSSWIKAQVSYQQEFHWQGGYAAFSVSPSHVDKLREYIADQENHHAHESFQDEFRRICKKYGVDIDERYVWD
ncbi:IS200/IS605 family transposase [Anatilimnocola sp. NA78]|uniref:IS200/IS605 family transposase n=1 Tax=Anatilimnocola sp. NA78 TaxID=3415683 RepID=UPI003CE55080